ncbi:ABC transporter permease [Candidatus Lucifugimonas marina]|uniref:ABC transporter permease subunit n=1 Tax=Candidatus Lucifugimonas marina TaxID=3038979 RepID=A0AAJ5ZCD1_9CHLR|nr:ABC transporter permease subunit [SAR202 cluster bacterium JH702]MDG0870868.1 ABC transporter permease subunit [SAR202 cluster bacterium JH639]WFG34756.1 ABC transporter permease subunit [SAR202 cluster bacterium JH545]WFG38683.1 ABC transporter permease subunit [SAR202 cluster bacterium JH1073]
MKNFLARRLIFSVLSLFIASMAVFGLAHAKEDPINLFIQPGYFVSPETLEALKAKWGLDKPLALQYLTWAGNMLRGDLGESVQQQRPVTTIVGEKWGATFQLAIVAWIFGTVTGIPLGIISALQRGRVVDYLARGVALFGQTLPAFWIGLVGIWIFAVWLGWLPVFGRGEGLPFWQQAKHYVLPTLVLGWGPMAGYMRITRSAMLEVLDSEYIKLARAKGVSNRMVVWKHAFRNALIQPLTIATLLLAGFMDGAVLVEVIFAWPGVGRVAVEAVNQNDFMLITGTVFIFTFLYLIMSLVADLLYTVADPRIRLS